MNCPITLFYVAKGLQIAAAIVGGTLPFLWVRAKNGKLEVATDLLKQAKIMSIIVLWVLALGFILELWHMICLNQS
jgi:hypothetical protein